MLRCPSKTHPPLKKSLPGSSTRAPAQCHEPYVSETRSPLPLTQPQAPALGRGCPRAPPGPGAPPPPSQRALTHKTNLCLQTITCSLTLSRNGDEKGFSKTSVTWASARAFQQEHGCCRLHDANLPAAQPGTAQPKKTREWPQVSPYLGCPKPAAARSQDRLQPLCPAAPRDGLKCFDKSRFRGLFQE